MGMAKIIFEGEGKLQSPMLMGKTPNEWVKLILSGNLVEVVLCKDCVHRGEPTECPMCDESWIEYGDGDGYHDTDIVIHDRSIDNGFCDRGERTDGE